MKTTDLIRYLHKSIIVQRILNQYTKREDSKADRSINDVMLSSTLMKTQISRQGNEVVDASNSKRVPVKLRKNVHREPTHLDMKNLVLMLTK